jgi:hypothetical protein
VNRINKSPRPLGSEKDELISPVNVIFLSNPPGSAKLMNVVRQQ